MSVGLEETTDVIADFEDSALMKIFGRESGAVFPAHGLPGWLGTAVLVHPLTYAVDAVRRTLPVDAAAPGVEIVGTRSYSKSPPRSRRRRCPTGSHGGPGPIRSTSTIPPSR